MKAPIFSAKGKRPDQKMLQELLWKRVVFRCILFPAAGPMDNFDRGIFCLLYWLKQSGDNILRRKKLIKTAIPHLRFFCFQD
jgi:hypothetical protein